jgi:hypothetical protein
VARGEDTVVTAAMAWIDSVAGGVEERELPAACPSPLTATIVRGVLFLDGDCPRTGTVPKTVLLDISGRKVLDLRQGVNDVRHMAPGVYFVRIPGTEDGRPRIETRKVVLGK